MRTFLRSSSDERPDEAAVRERRIELARRNPHWTELEEAHLVHRARLLVHADSDEMFTYYRGPVFSPGSGSISFNGDVPMSFYVDRAGDVVFLERQSGTWSELVEKRERRRLSRR